jgi:intracellular septation protein A
VTRRTTVGGVLRSSVPRLILNSLAPVGAYWAGSRLGGVLAGVALATAASTALWARERRAGRPGLLARIALAVVLVQAVAGALSNSPFLYFAPKAAVDILQGVACYVSCLTRWPLASIFARELVRLPRTVYDEPPVRRLFVGLTVVWATYFTLRGVVTMVVLATASTDTYLLVRALIDAPVVVPLVAVSLAYGLRQMRQLAPPQLRVTGDAA